MREEASPSPDHETSTSAARGGWRDRVRSASAPRFVLIGLSNNAIGYAIVWTGVHLPFEHPYKAAAAQMVAYVIGSIWSFVWNRRWTFRATESAASGQAWRFGATQVGFAIGTSLAMNAAVDRARWPVTPSWLGITAGATFANYALARFWVFRPGRTDRESSLR